MLLFFRPLFSSVGFSFPLLRLLSMPHFLVLLLSFKKYSTCGVLVIFSVWYFFSLAFLLPSINSHLLPSPTPPHFLPSTPPPPHLSPPPPLFASHGVAPAQCAVNSSPNLSSLVLFHIVIPLCLPPSSPSLLTSLPVSLPLLPSPLLYSLSYAAPFLPLLLFFYLSLSPFSLPLLDATPPSLRPCLFISLSSSLLDSSPCSYSSNFSFLFRFSSCVLLNFCFTSSLSFHISRLFCPFFYLLFFSCIVWFTLLIFFITVFLFFFFYFLLSTRTTCFFFSFFTLFSITFP